MRSVWTCVLYLKRPSMCCSDCSTESFIPGRAHGTRIHGFLWRPQVLAAGDAPLAYQWWLGSTPVEGATSPVLAVAGARKALHQGMYTIQVSLMDHFSGGASV